MIQHTQLYKKKKKKNNSFCIDCGILLSKSKYTRCCSCSNKKKWQNKEYKLKTITNMKKPHTAFISTENMKRIGSQNGRWLGGVTAKCETCGKLLSRNKFKKCNSCNRLGELHMNWKNGKSFEPYPLGWTKTYKEQIRYRDGYKCQICGVPEIECDVRLHIHHIDYNKNNININNLISLCHSCHMKTNYNRQYWRQRFYDTTYK